MTAATSLPRSLAAEVAATRAGTRGLATRSPAHDSIVADAGGPLHEAKQTLLTLTPYPSEAQAHLRAWRGGPIRSCVTRLKAA